MNFLEERIVKDGMAKEKKNKDTVEALYSLDGKINLLKAFPFGL